MAYRRRARGRTTRRPRTRKTRRHRTRRALAPRRMRRMRVPHYRSGGYAMRRMRRGLRKMGPNRSGPVSFRSTGKSVIFRHEEFIGDLISSSSAGAFQAQVFQINPALVNSFNFASGIAINFEEYRIRSMHYVLKSTSFNAVYSASSSQASGVMGMTVVYNPYVNTGFFSNKVICESYGDEKISGNPSRNLSVRVSTSKSKNPMDVFYTRSGPPPNGQSLTTCDPGYIVFWSSGLQGTSVPLAEIHCVYEFEFLKPRPGSSSIGLGILTAKYQYLSTLPNGTAPTVTNWWGGAGGNTAFAAAGPGQSNNALMPNANNNLQLTFANPSGASAFAFPPALVAGNYLVVISAKGTNAAAATILTVPTFTNCVVDGIWSNGLGTAAYANGFAWGGVSDNAVSDTGTVYSITMSLTITAANASVSFASPTNWPSTITALDFMVTQINGGITTIT